MCSWEFFQRVWRGNARFLKSLSQEIHNHGQIPFLVVCRQEDGVAVGHIELQQHAPANTCGRAKPVGAVINLVVEDFFSLNCVKQLEGDSELAGPGVSDGSWLRETMEGPDKFTGLINNSHTFLEQCRILI